MDRERIETYAAGADSPGAAIAGLSREELNAFPVPGTWSIQQIILHLADSDLIGSDRMKRIIAEDRPTLVGYDESRFARSLYYEHQDPRLACELFALNRRMTAEIFRRLPDEAFARVGVHNEKGEVTLAGQINGYIEHLEYHLRFVTQKREMLKKA